MTTNQRQYEVYETWYRYDISVVCLWSEYAKQREWNIDNISVKRITDKGIFHYSDPIESDET